MGVGLLMIDPPHLSYTTPAALSTVKSKPPYYRHVTVPFTVRPIRLSHAQILTLRHVEQLKMLLCTNSRHILEWVKFWHGN